jgi:hypothetical protein
MQPDPAGLNGAEEPAPNAQKRINFHKCPIAESRFNVGH